MKQFIRSIFPSEFYSHPEYFRAFALGSFYLLLLVLQLFHFETLYPIVDGYALPGGVTTAAVVVGLIPLLEFIALPHLFSIGIPKRMRVASKIAVVATPLLWVGIVVWLGMTGNVLVEVGIFGSTVAAYYGWWTLLFITMLLASALVVVRESADLHPQA